MRHLENTQVVVGLGVVTVVHQRYPEALIGQTAVAHGQRRVAQVVPDLGELGVAGRQAQRALEAGEYHVVLLRVQAAQSDVVEELTVVDAHLQGASVELERHFGLIAVKVVGRNVGDRFHLRAVRMEHLLVGAHAIVHVA